MLRTLPRHGYGRKASRNTWNAMLIFVGIIFLGLFWASLKELREAQRIRSSPAVQSYYASVPHIRLETLSPSLKEKVLSQLNSSKCDCNCALTLAQCRNTDRTCKRGLDLALQVLIASSR